MILMPPTKHQEIRISPGGYHLLIVPGHVARDEALSMHYEYWGDEHTKAERNTVRVKDQENRPGSRSRAGHVFAAWNREYRDAWHLLPAPSRHGQAADARQEATVTPRGIAPRADHGTGLQSPRKAGAPRSGPARDPAAGNYEVTVTPRDVVRSLEYLQRAGMSAAQVCQMHHFDKHQSYASLISYFGKTSRLGSDTNRWFGERLAYVVREHKEGRSDGFAPLISQALQRWRIRH